MQTADADIDWTRASDDFGLIEACRAAASIALPFETLRVGKTRRPGAFAAWVRGLFAPGRDAVRF